MKKEPRLRARADGRAEDVRERILQAGRRLLSTGGVEALTVAAIAQEAEVYASAVNYHFGSKEGLWVALVSQLLREAEQSTLDRVMSIEAGPERLRNVVESYDMIGGADAQRAFLAMLVPALSNESLKAKLQALYRQGAVTLAMDLGGAEDINLVPALSVYGRIVLAFAGGLIIQHLVEPERDFSSELSAFEHMLEDALLPLLGLQVETADEESIGEVDSD